MALLPRARYKVNIKPGQILVPSASSLQPFCFAPAGGRDLLIRAGLGSRPGEFWVIQCVIRIWGLQGVSG